MFVSVLSQREGARVVACGVRHRALRGGAGRALVLALRDDGLRTGAAGLGLGLATGIAALMSASIGYLLARHLDRRGGRRAAARAGRLVAHASRPARSAR